MRARRFTEEIAIMFYVILTLGIVPYIDSSGRRIVENWLNATMHLCILGSLLVVLYVGRKLALRFRGYGLWGWRETLSVTFLTLYGFTGSIVRPQGLVLREATWIVCILIQGIILACALYLEGWFRGDQGQKGTIEARRLANGICWQLFSACWTALAAAIVVAGIVIGFGSSIEVKGAEKGDESIIAVILYLILTVAPVFIWIMRPCFNKSVGIIKGLEDSGKRAK